MLTPEQETWLAGFADRELFIAARNAADSAIDDAIKEKQRARDAYLLQVQQQKEAEIKAAMDAYEAANK